MRITASVACLLLLVATPCASANTIYNNLDGPTDAGSWFNDTPDVLSAQPIFLGENDTVASVEIGLFRIGQPNGTLFFNIFDDSGDGTPGESVGQIGSIDPLAIATNAADYVFDSSVSGLLRNANYFVVVSHDGTNWGNANQVGWGLTTQPGAANAGEALAIQPPQVADWHTINNFPSGGPPFPVWFFAKIEAVPEPSSFALGAIGMGLLFSIARFKSRHAH